MDEYDGYIFHYTDAHALLQIATSRKVWATHYQYLNDRLEGTLTYERLRGMLHPTHSIAVDAIKGRDPKHLDALRENLHSSLGASVVCFSTVYSSLTQYRMYCPPAGGFAIGFPRDFIAKHGQLINCSYSDSELTDWCRSYIGLYCAAAAGLDSATLSAHDLDTQVRTHHPELTESRLEASLRFKSREFTQEREVRLVARGGTNKYRASRNNNFIVPYIEVELNNEKINVMIACGPNRDEDLAPSTASSLFRAGLKQTPAVEWEFSQLGTGRFGFRNF